MVAPEWPGWVPGLLRGACTVALVASLGSFAVLALQPGIVERHLQATVVAMVEREVSARFGTVQGTAAQETIRAQLGRATAALRDAVDGDLPEHLAPALVGLCRHGCSATDAAATIRGGLRDRISHFEVGVERVRGWAKSRYVSLIDELVLELRVFTGTNAVLLLLALIGLVRSRNHTALYTLSVLVLTATLASASCYVVNQDWLMTIVFGTYMGWGYLASASLVFAFLVDIVFLRGTMTHLILAAAAAAISGAS